MYLIDIHLILLTAIEIVMDAEGRDGELIVIFLYNKYFHEIPVNPIVYGNITWYHNIGIYNTGYNTSNKAEMGWYHNVHM